MTDDRMHARDAGGDISFRGVDRGTHRESYSCRATCHCGAKLDADCLSGLRDRLALHVLDCPGPGALK